MLLDPWYPSIVLKLILQRLLRLCGASLALKRSQDSPSRCVFITPFQPLLSCEPHISTSEGNQKWQKPCFSMCLDFWIQFEQIQHRRLMKLNPRLNLTFSVWCFPANKQHKVPAVRVQLKHHRHQEANLEAVYCQLSSICSYRLALLPRVTCVFHLLSALMWLVALLGSRAVVSFSSRFSICCSV